MALLFPNAAAPSAAGAGFTLPPNVWRAGEMASFRSATIRTGCAALDAELPDRGWPTGALSELLTSQPGIGEMRLLLPALQSLNPRKVALIQPPHLVQAAAWAVDGFGVDRLLWVKAQRSADALWAAEQVLRSRAAGAVLLWQPHVRPESLRRLHLAAQSGEAAFWFFRSLASAQDASPAPLRLALRPAPEGISVTILKRRGPHHDTPLFIPLASPAARPIFLDMDHAPVDLRDSAAAIARSVPASMG